MEDYIMEQKEFHKLILKNTRNSPIPDKFWGYTGFGTMAFIKALHNVNLISVKLYADFILDTCDTYEQIDEYIVLYKEYLVDFFWDNFKKEVLLVPFTQGDLSRQILLKYGSIKNYISQKGFTQVGTYYDWTSPVTYKDNSVGIKRLADDFGHDYHNLYASMLYDTLCAIVLENRTRGRIRMKY